VSKLDWTWSSPPRAICQNKISDRGARGALTFAEQAKTLATLNRYERRALSHRAMLDLRDLLQGAN